MEEQYKQEEKSPQEQRHPRPWSRLLSRILRTGTRLFLGLFLVVFLLGLLLQLPFVQKAVVRQITHSMERTLQVPVSIQSFRLGWKGQLNLGEVFIGGPESGDTLLASRGISVWFNPNPISIIQNGLSVEELRIEGTHFRLQQVGSGNQTNLQVLLDRLFPASVEKKAPKRPFQLRLKRLILDEVRFTKTDGQRGNTLYAYLKHGEARIGDMDLPGKILRVRTLTLQNPVLRIGSYPSAPGYVFPEETTSASDSTLGWTLEVGKMELHRGSFRSDNYAVEPEYIPTPGFLNYRHLYASEIEMVVRRFQYEQETFSGSLENLNFQEQNGLKIKHFSVDEVLVNGSEATLNGLRLRTPDSDVGDTLQFKYAAYSDFGDFPNKVRMDARFSRSKIAIPDLWMFAPKLETVALFAENREEILSIDGRISGRVNTLAGQGLRISLRDGSRIEGAFSSRNLAVKHEEALNLRLSRFSSSVRKMRAIFPGLKLPPSFDKLGHLDFSGSFTGFFEDFVAYGNLRTDLGTARMDMQMVVRQGKERASYSGKLQLIDFNLGKWTNNPDLGLVSLNTRIANGKGLTAETAMAELNAEIQKLTFKGYNYQNALLEGTLRSNQFNGNFSIRDENIDFSFLGRVDFSRDVPQYSFKADVNHIALRPLHLSGNRDISIGGEIALDFRNTAFSDIEGQAHIRAFRVAEGGQMYQMDSATLATRLDPLGNKVFSIESDVLQAQFSGLFEIERIPAMMLQHIATHYPNFSRRFGLKSTEKKRRPSRFDFSLEVLNSKGFENLIDRRLGSLSGIRAAGFFDNQKAILKANVESDWLQFDRIYAEDIAFFMDTKGGSGSVDFGINRIVLNEKQEFEPITALMLIHGDTLDYGLNYARKNRESTPKGMDNLNINGQLVAIDSNTLVNRIVYSEVELLGKAWKINPENKVVLGKDYIRVSDFRLVQDDKVILLQNKGSEGLALSLSRMDINELNPIIGFRPIAFGGRMNISVSAEDIFRQRNLSLAAVSDTFYMNRDDWGILRIDAHVEDNKHPVHGFISLTRDTVQFIGEGFFNLADIGEQPMQKKGYFDLNVNIHSFPLAVAEYFIGETISHTHGYFDADVHFSGDFVKPRTTGEIYLFDGGVTIDFLKTHYTVDRAVAKVNDFLFDVTGTILKDKYGNSGRLVGGVAHRYLHKFGFDARLVTDRMLALDTKKGDNSTFYGHAVGKGEVVFSGLFQRPDIYVNAQVGEDTRIVIPVTEERTASSLNFITFVDKDKSGATASRGGTTSTAGESGVSFEMDLVATEPAILQIIFNEQAGDIIEGMGRANLRFMVPRNGSFQMFGDVVIERGEYLFTLYNVINKDFDIRRGGTLTWSGDPFKAIMNIEAEYKDLKAPVSNFIQEFLSGASDKTRSLAAQNTDVDLTLKLQGDLLKPAVTFDIAFPSLRGELESYAGNKLRLLQRDPNEMNKQIFGLIVAGQFLPADFSFQGSQIIYNTVSEMLSNQLSLLLTELFSDLVGGGPALSGLDFDIAYSQYQSSVAQTPGTSSLNRGNELQVSLRQNYFNDRLSILVGGNIGLGNSSWRTAVGASGAFIGNDVVIEYALVEDRSLKLRIYQKLQPDIGGRILQIGSGLSYRREYDTFGEFLRSMKEGLRKPWQKGPVNRRSINKDTLLPAFPGVMVDSTSLR